jgi:hypothetical protein
MERALSLAVDELAGIDLSTWSDAAIADEFVALRRDLDRLEAVAARLLVGVHDRLVPFGEGASSTPAWAQWRAGQRFQDAKASLDAGFACAQLPLVAKAWAQGEISASAARSITRGMRDGHEDLYREREEKLVGLAARREFRELDGEIRKYRRRVDELDDKEPRDRNGVFLSRVLDRWVLDGDLDALSGEIGKAALDAATDAPSEGDDRTPAQRRADGLVRIWRRFLDLEDLPIEAGEAPHVSLTISWETIQSWLPCPTAPTDLASALSKHEIHRMLCDANVARIILGPDGQPLDVGREHRTAPRWLRRAVGHRDGGCRYPGCDRQPNRCEVHHVWSWETGGPTAVHNLVLLCSFHHHVVHRNGWTNHFDGITYTIRNQHGRRIE